jgi:hypothetical protein
VVSSKLRSAQTCFFLSAAWPSSFSREMSGLADPPSRNTFTAGTADAPGKTRKLPVLPSSIPSSAQSTGDSMEVTPPTSTTTGPAPPAHSSPDSDRAGANIANSNGSVETGNMNNTLSNQAIGAAAAAQQPKVVQTAFIHKLYKYVCSDSVRSHACLKPFVVLYLPSAPFDINHMSPC